jgi:hypothetical protein
VIDHPLLDPSSCGSAEYMKMLDRIDVSHLSGHLLTDSESGQLLRIIHLPGMTLRSQIIIVFRL